MSRLQTRGEGIPKSYRTTSHSLGHSAAGMSTLKGSELYPHPHPPGRPKHRRVATASEQAGSQTERDLGTQKDTGPRRGIVRNTRSRRQFPALHSHRQKKATPQKLEYRRPFFLRFRPTREELGEELSEVAHACMHTTHAPIHASRPNCILSCCTLGVTDRRKGFAT